MGLFTKLSAGAYHSCGLRVDDAVVCWGSSGAGKTIAPTGKLQRRSPPAVRIRARCEPMGQFACWGEHRDGQSRAPSGEFEAITSGYRHFLCPWDERHRGVLGSRQLWAGSLPERARSPSIAAGGGHTCGVREGGEVVCWGVNAFGQAIPPGGQFVSVTAGGWHSCGLAPDNSVTCWGSQEENELD